MSESDDLRQIVTPEDLAWATETGNSHGIAKVLLDYVEELVEKTGLPRELIEAKVFAAYRRLYDEDEG